MGGRVPHLCLQSGAQFHSRAGWNQGWRPGRCLIPMLGLGMRLHVQLHSHTGTVWQSWVEILCDCVLVYHAKSAML